MYAVVQYLLSFGLVIGLLIASLWAIKRFQTHGGFRKRAENSRLHILETVSVGARQKIMLIRLDDQDVLLGITPGEITPLHIVSGQPNTTQEWLRRRQS